MELAFSDYSRDDHIGVAYLHSIIGCYCWEEFSCSFSLNVIFNGILFHVIVIFISPRINIFLKSFLFLFLRMGD